MRDSRQIDDVRVIALASGSSGNSVLVSVEGIHILIDAGLSATRLSGHLKKFGVGAGNLHAILLTHEHTDHSCGVLGLTRRTSATVVASQGTLEALAQREELPQLTRVIKDQETIGSERVGIRAFAVKHDAVEPLGFVIEAGKYRIAYCTDLGCVTESVRAAIRGADLGIIEANHDLQWLLKGSYTPEMKARVASETGHLSNDDCADLLAERLESDGPMSIWLAHLSRVNNSPSLARRSVTSRICTNTSTAFNLQVALRDHPSLEWRAGSQAVQLSLFSG